MVLPQDAPYCDGADVAMNHADDGGDVSSSIIVIENISSVANNSDQRQEVVVAIDNIGPVPDAAAEAVAVVVADDEDASAASAASHLLSLSSATSATSIASALSDGVSRPRSQQQQHHELHHHHHQNLRPRSVSLNLPPTSSTTQSTPRSGNGTPIRSMSGSRPRSNPRTRTPMRHVSPLLVTGRIVFDGGNTESTSTTAYTDDHHGEETDTSTGGEIAQGEVNLHSAVEDEVIVVDAHTVPHERNNGATSPRDNSVLIRNSSSRQRSGMTGQDDIIPEEEEDEVEAVAIVAAVNENRNEPNSSSMANIIVVQENEVAVLAVDPPSAPLDNNSHRPASLRHGTSHWLAQPASSTVHSTTTTTRRSSHNPTRRRRHPQDGTTRTLSNKQHPSHRKLRRWNNDRFVGTASEHLHNTMMGDQDDNNINDDYDHYWRQHYMPNYPCKYRSEFSKLVVDDTKKGQGVRDRFLKGEVGDRVVGNSSTTVMTEEVMHRMIAEKFQKKLGISLSKNLSAASTGIDNEKCAIDITTNSSMLGNVNKSMGVKIFRNLSPRIQTILSRICATMHEEELSIGSVTTTDPFFAMALQLVSSFESYLISLALVGSKKDVVPTVGYPPLQSQQTYDLFDKVLSSPPKIVMRSRSRHNHSAFLHSSDRQKVHAVCIPTVHFYFEADGDNQGRNSKRGSGRGSTVAGGGNDGKNCNSAFYRILLYAVCQFHGLDSTSSFVTSNGKSPSRKGGNAGCTTTKVVTVQGGWLLAPSLKILDACSMSVNSC